ncbi:MAG: sodium/pantothenate symporter [Succinivibrio sp.]|jgi:sodium/pantothenate symporter|nr:sodium/pantothenate symporter [Succinivibrio sp.]
MSVNPVVIPVAIFLAVLLAIGVWCNRSLRRSKNFQRDYFIANRSLGGVVLALTLVATYGSVSSFVSGPGVAWNVGFGWVVFAAPQIITGFFILGILGKKMAVLARRTGSLTVIDLIDARYHSKSVAVLLALVLIIFFTATVVGQFIGGAQIFAAITGYDYKIGLLIFAVVTVIYTSSGFKAVVLTDAVCAILMLTGMFTLGWSVLEAGGGLSGIMQTLSQTNLGDDGISNLFKPDAGGSLPYTLLFSAWLLVGFCTLGLPQSMVRCMSYKSSRNLSTAMIVATVVCGALMIGMTLLGVLSRGVILDKPANGTDAVIPLLIVNYMSPVMAGITIIGPLAATMSTVSSLLISAASAVARDLVRQVRGDAYLSSMAPAASRHFAIGVTLVLGAVSILLALYPQDIVVWVNMFAFGGLESAFMWPVVLGLFWSGMNARGALWGIVAGLGLYTLCMATGFKFMAFHNIIIGTAAGLVFSVIGAKLGQQPSQQIKEIFFPEKI